MPLDRLSSPPQDATGPPSAFSSALGPFEYGPFSVAPFAGHRVRLLLEEMQKPNIGRRHAMKDRRPIDPPPVIQMRVFKLSDDGKEDEVTPLEDAHIHGFLCKADLFRVPAPDLSAEPSGSSPVRRRAKARASLPINDSISAYLDDGKPVMASSHTTSLLSGSDIVQARNLELPGHQRAVVFVFGDISVKEDGYFCLQFKIFDVFSRIVTTGHAPVLAEFFSSRFRVFSTKTFPGLEASTELTKSLKMSGFRVAVRENVRVRGAGGAKQALREDDDSSTGSD